jgi:hypothetical protein
MAMKMYIESKDITIIFQGEENPDLRQNIEKTLSILPDAKIIISLIDHKNEKYFYPYRCIYTKDPGTLIGYKFFPKDLVNNINRQIASSFAGLSQVTTPYALKIRTDSYMENSSFLDYYNRYGTNNNTCSRIIAPSFFTVDPRVFEQMTYHLSDWFHFGKTETLIQIWSASLMNSDDASYYEMHEYQPSSTYFDKQFRARYSPEQHVMIQYANSLGYLIPKFHNDITKDILAEHDRFIQERFLILNMDQIGLKVPKYEWVSSSGFQFLNCLFFEDWCAVSETKSAYDVVLYRKKLRMKKLFSYIIRTLTPFLPFIKRIGLLRSLGYWIRLVKFLYYRKGNL